MPKRPVPIPPLRRAASAGGWLLASLPAWALGAAAPAPPPPPHTTPAASTTAPGRAATTAPAPSAAVHLRIVGGLARANQFVLHEEPFWSRELPRLTDGQTTAEIVPFDRAGVRATEMLRLVRLGTVPFGTVLLQSSDDPDLYAADLAGMHPDFASLRRAAAAFRPYLAARLRERYDAELLALYTYSAQVVFCTRPLASLADLRDRRVRIAGPTQADLVASVGGLPVSLPFAEIVPNVASGNLDCAITGALAGNMIGLTDVTGYLLDLTVNYGLSAFVVNGAVWRALPPRTRATLEHELPRLERDIWHESETEATLGVACDIGTATACRGGRPGRMRLVTPGPDSIAQRRRGFVDNVLPRWLQRCGAVCAEAWRQLGGTEATAASGSSTAPAGTR